MTEPLLPEQLVEKWRKKFDDETRQANEAGTDYYRGTHTGAATQARECALELEQWAALRVQPPQASEQGEGFNQNTDHLNELRRRLVSLKHGILSMSSNEVSKEKIINWLDEVLTGTEALRAGAPTPPQASEQALQKATTRLYRQLKEWSKRKFSADYVTWCEVKAELATLLSEAQSEWERSRRAGAPTDRNAPSEGECENCAAGLPVFQNADGNPAHSLGDVELPCTMSIADYTLAAKPGNVAPTKLRDGCDAVRHGMGYSVCTACSPTLPHRFDDTGAAESNEPEICDLCGLDRKNSIHMNVAPTEICNARGPHYGWACMLPKGHHGDIHHFEDLDKPALTDKEQK